MSGHEVFAPFPGLGRRGRHGNRFDPLFRGRKLVGLRLLGDFHRHGRVRVFRRVPGFGAGVSAPPRRRCCSRCCRLSWWQVRHSDIARSSSTRSIRCNCRTRRPTRRNWPISGCTTSPCCRFSSPPAVHLALLPHQHASRIGQVYAADLIGAGAGSVLVLGLMYLLPPFTLIPALLPALALAGGCVGRYRLRAGLAALWCWPGRNFCWRLARRRQSAPTSRSIPPRIRRVQKSGTDRKSARRISAAG